MFFASGAAGRHAPAPETTTGPTHAAPPDADNSTFPPAPPPAPATAPKADARPPSEPSCDRCASSKPTAHAIMPAADASPPQLAPPASSPAPSLEGGVRLIAGHIAATLAASFPTASIRLPMKPRAGLPKTPCSVAARSAPGLCRRRVYPARNSPPGPSITRGGVRSAPPAVVWTAFMARSFPRRGPGVVRSSTRPPAAEPRSRLSRLRAARRVNRVPICPARPGVRPNRRLPYAPGTPPGADCPTRVERRHNAPTPMPTKAMGTTDLRGPHFRSEYTPPGPRRKSIDLVGYRHPTTPSHAEVRRTNSGRPDACSPQDSLSMRVHQGVYSGFYQGFP